MTDLNIAVLGAGVVGVTTAVELQKRFRHAKIEILAEHVYEDTTSYVAAGVFRPGTSFCGPTQEITQHNQVAGVIHQELCVQMGLLTAKVPYYKYQPQTVLENESWKILWDLIITTDRTVSHNRPDILVFDKKQRKAQVIDIQIPADENVGKSRMEKVLKYQELADEIKRMYQLEKVEIYPIIISCNGLVDKYLPRNLKAISIRNPKQIVAISQKAVILATCHTVRRILATDGRVGL